jgi:molecular chaperone GrpE
MSRRIPIRVAGDNEAECRTEAEGLVEQAREESEGMDPRVRAPAPQEKATAPAEEESWRGRYLRLQADFENFRRHAEAERSRLTGLGKEAALADIFPLVDHLDRGLAWAREHGADPAVVEGLLLVQKELHKVLEKNGITRLTTIGEAFNPELHEAVSVIARAGAEAGEVVEELQAGFMRDGRVLRPARVVVAG